MSAQEIHVLQLRRSAFEQHWGQQDLLLGTTQAFEAFEGVGPVRTVLKDDRWWKVPKQAQFCLHCIRKTQDQK